MHKQERPDGPTPFNSIVKTIDIEELENLVASMPLYVESNLKNHTLVPIDFSKFKSDFSAGYKLFQVEIHTHSMYLEAMLPK